MQIDILTLFRDVRRPLTRASSSGAEKRLRHYVYKIFGIHNGQARTTTTPPMAGAGAW